MHIKIYGRGGGRDERFNAGAKADADMVSVALGSGKKWQPDEESFCRKWW